MIQKNIFINTRIIEDYSKIHYKLGNEKRFCNSTFSWVVAEIFSKTLQ